MDSVASSDQVIGFGAFALIATVAIFAIAALAHWLRYRKRKDAR